MIKLCVFDFDSTLMDGETIDIIAKAYGVGEQVKAITRAAMAGEIDFFESLSKRVSLLKGMPQSEVAKICENLPLINGAYELMDFLHSKNIMTAVFSGGFHEGIDPAKKKLKFNLGFANYLHHKNGILTGLVGGEMMFSNSKGLMVARLKELLKFKQEEVMCVGDGANDVAMFAEGGLNVAFCAKPILREKADICIDTKDLKEVIKVIK